jgi:hypothetical protein
MPPSAAPVVAPITSATVAAQCAGTLTHSSVCVLDVKGGTRKIFLPTNQLETE